MIGLYYYYKKNDKSTDQTKFGGGRPLPEDSTINPPAYLFVIINFIDTWINTLEKNVRGIIITINII